MSTRRARRWRPVRWPPSRKQTRNLLARLPPTPLRSPSIETPRGPNEPDKQTLQQAPQSPRSGVSRSTSGDSDGSRSTARASTGSTSSEQRLLGNAGGTAERWWGHSLNVQSWSRRNWSPWPRPQARPPMASTRIAARTAAAASAKSAPALGPCHLVGCAAAGALLGDNSDGLRHLRLLRQGSLLPLLQRRWGCVRGQALLLHPVALLHAVDGHKRPATFPALPALLPPGEGLCGVVPGLLRLHQPARMPLQEQRSWEINEARFLK